MDLSSIPTISHHADKSPAEILRELALAAEGAEKDRYGDGGVVADLEERIVELLGTEAAVVMPSGTMAQQIALRIWSQRSGVPRVAFHPLAHLERGEEMGYRRLQGLDSVLVGERHRLLTVDDLDAVPEALAALLLELPQREIGGVLPPWDDLRAVVERAGEEGIARHLDGARLWETKPFYQRTYSEIAGLFDSVYVSFYKIIDGLSGAALAGTADFIDEARIWRRRHGGTLIHLWPMAVSAMAGLDRHLPRIAEYHERAIEIAAMFAAIDGVRVSPDPPHTNMMHVFVDGDHDRLVERHETAAAEHGRVLFRTLHPTEVPDCWAFEITVGSVACDLDDALIERLIRDALDPRATETSRLR